MNHYSQTQFYDSRLLLGGYLFGQGETDSITGNTSNPDPQSCPTTAPKTTIRGDRLIAEIRTTGASSDRGLGLLTEVMLNDIQLAYTLVGKTGYDAAGTPRICDPRSVVNPAIGCLIRNQDTVSVKFGTADQSANTYKGFAQWRAAVHSPTAGIEQSTPNAGSQAGTGRIILCGADSGTAASSAAEVTFSGTVNSAQDLTVHNMVVDTGLVNGGSPLQIQALRWQDDDMVTPGTSAKVHYEAFDWQSPSFSFLGRRITTSDNLIATFSGAFNGGNAVPFSFSISAKLA